MATGMKARKVAHIGYFNLVKELVLMFSILSSKICLLLLYSSEALLLQNLLFESDRTTLMILHTIYKPCHIMVPPDLLSKFEVFEVFSCSVSHLMFM